MYNKQYDFNEMKKKIAENLTEGEQANQPVSLTPGLRDVANTIGASISHSFGKTMLTEAEAVSRFYEVMCADATIECSDATIELRYETSKLANATIELARKTKTIAYTAVASVIIASIAALAACALAWVALFAGAK